MGNNFREVKEDLLKDWLSVREETGLAFLKIGRASCRERV